MLKEFNGEDKTVKKITNAIEGQLQFEYVSFVDV